MSTIGIAKAFYPGDYGVLFNGATDGPTMTANVSGYNAMIADAAVGGGTCYLPGGIAVFNGDLNHAPMVNLIGQGAGSTNIGYNPPSYAFGATVLRMHTANHGPQFLQTGVAPGPTNESWYWNGGRIAGIDFDGGGIGTIGCNFRMMTMGHMTACNFLNWTDTAVKLDASIGNLLQNISIYNTPTGFSATSFNPGAGDLCPNFSRIENCDFNKVSLWGINWDNFSSLRVANCNFSYGGTDVAQPNNSGNILVQRPGGSGSGIGLICDRIWMEAIHGGFGIKIDEAINLDVWHSICNSVVSFGAAGFYGVHMAVAGGFANHLTTHTCWMTAAGHSDVTLSGGADAHWHQGPGLYTTVETAGATVTTWG